MPDQNFYSLLPLGIVLIVLYYSRNYILALSGALLGGTILLGHFNPLGILQFFVREFLYQPVTEPYKASVLVFIALYCGYVGTMEFGGAIRGFAFAISQKIRSPKGAQIALGFTGFLVFFSDLGCPVILGDLYRKICDTYGVSREKAAWLIDVTAAPLCSLVPIVGWGVVAMSLMENLLRLHGEERHFFTTYLATLPYIYFPLFLLFMGFVSLLWGKDWGFMGQKREIMEEIFPSPEPEMLRHQGPPAILWLSLGTILGTFVLQLLADGTPLEKTSGLTIMVFLGSSFFLGGFVALMGMHLKGSVPFLKGYAIYASNFRRVLSVTVILVLAWSFSSLCYHLGTGFCLSYYFGQIIPHQLFPAFLFLIATGLAFWTGSAWGTYAVIFPLAFSGALSFGVLVELCMGAVISGAVCGDYCSPRSHSPRVTAQSMGIPLERSLKAQHPYTLLAGGITLGAYGFSPYLSSPVSVLFWGSIFLGFLYILCTYLFATPSIAKRNS